MTHLVSRMWGGLSVILLKHSSYMTLKFAGNMSYDDPNGKSLTFHDPRSTSTDPAAAAGGFVRGEEVAIVVLVLVLWAAAIALFINRWGKIRLMEPYQPYFEQEAPPQAAAAVATAAGGDCNGSVVTAVQRPSLFEHRSSLTFFSAAGEES